MTSCRNWSQTQLPCSFRGVGFHATTYGPKGGRRGPTHEYAASEEWANEDMGRKAHALSVSGYVIGDDADAQAAALFAACESAVGPGTLVLPHGIFEAVCRDVEYAWSEEEQGRIEFTFEFALEPQKQTALAPSFMFAALVANAVTAAASLIGAAFAGSVQYSGWSDPVWERSADGVQLFAAMMADGTDRVTLDQSSPDRIAEAARLKRDIGDLALRPAAWLTAPAALSEMMALCLTRFVDLSADPYQAAQALRPMTAFQTYAGPPAILTRPRLMAASNEQALDALVKGLLALFHAYALSLADWSDRQLALKARAEIAISFDDPLRLAASPEAYGALLHARGVAAEGLSRIITTLVPVVTIEADIQRSAIWWAHYLYADATRADDLITRNRVPSPAFMPQQFQALTR